MPSAKELAERDKYLAEVPAWELIDSNSIELKGVRLALGEEPVAIYRNPGPEFQQHDILFTSTGLHVYGKFYCYKNIEQVEYPLCRTPELQDLLKRKLGLKMRDGTTVSLYVMGEHPTNRCFDLSSLHSLIGKLSLFSKKW